MNSYGIALVAAVLAVVPISAQNPGAYSAWTKNDKQNRWECTYSYPMTGGGTGKQLVVVYPKNDSRSGWAYFYNDQNKPWARVAIKGNPKYSATEMYWQRLGKVANVYEDFADKAKSFSPTPKDAKSPFPKLPDPPVGT